MITNALQIPDTELLRRAVVNARSHHRRGRHQRWVAVMEVFACGSTEAVELCRRFDINPDEAVIP